MEPDYPKDVLVVSEQGFGKRSLLSDYRKTNRGTKGVKTLNITERTGKLIAVKVVDDNDDLMIINKSGVVIRLAVNTIKVQGRNTQGVSLINLKKRGDVISSVCAVAHEEITDDQETPDSPETSETLDTPEIPETPDTPDTPANSEN